MAISGPPQVEPDPGVRRIGLEHWDSYYEAAVKMYTEEVGVSPSRATRPVTGSTSAS